uniref:Uncharacterized protein n=1 Tax=Arion vulgaris TaxID=1028688 RepID=A0A0B7ANH7_9EUPU
MRTNDQRIAKHALKLMTNGLRKKGNPSETLKIILWREVRNIGLDSIEEIEKVAQDSAVWTKNYLQALCKKITI